MREGAMNQFPTFSAAWHFTQAFFRRPFVWLGMFAVVELVPLLIGPFAAYWMSLPFRSETFTHWLHPWSYSQVAFVGVACMAAPGRWHARLAWSLVALAAVFVAYWGGVELSYWRLRDGNSMRTLGADLGWLFALTALITSLLLSMFGPNLEWRTTNAGQSPVRSYQFSIRSLLYAMLVVCVALALWRAVMESPDRWIRPEYLLPESPRKFLQLANCAVGAAVATLMAAASQRHRIWLHLAIILTAVTDVSISGQGWRGLENYIVGGGWWLPLVVTIHPYLIVLLLPSVQVGLPRQLRLDSLRRILAAVH